MYVSLSITSLLGSNSNVLASSLLKIYSDDRLSFDALKAMIQKGRIVFPVRFAPKVIEAASHAGFHLDNQLYPCALELDDKLDAILPRTDSPKHMLAKLESSPEEAVVTIDMLISLLMSIPHSMSKSIDLVVCHDLGISFAKLLFGLVEIVSDPEGRQISIAERAIIAKAFVEYKPMVK